MAGYNQSSIGNNPSINNAGFFNKMLRKLSSYGMTYDIKSIKNTVSVGANEDTRDAHHAGNTNSEAYMYDLFTKKVLSQILDKKSIAYLDRTYFDKRKILRQYSLKDEIRDCVNQICDETIIYNDYNMFCDVNSISDDFDNTVKQKIKENFLKVYNNFKFNDGITAWNYFKDFLTDGYISYEIVYDDKQKSIEGLYKIDPLTLVVVSDPISGTVLWIQYPDNPQLRRVLLDSQIIYISYSNNNDFGDVSYIEGLVRPYNQLKLIEQAKIIFNMNQAAIYKKFIIPTGGLTRTQAEQQIYQLMSEYHEEVNWDEKMGTVQINGSSNIPHTKDIWVPSSAEGTPDIQIMNQAGNDLNEDQILKWFSTNLKKASRIPFARFETESGGGSIYNDASEITRDEMKFKNFIHRLRTVFKEIIIKPLRIQMYIDFPELKDDNLFKSNLNIIFNSNELFEEWKYLNNLEKRAQIASTLNSNLQDSEGKPYLAVEWIVRNIMKFTDEDIEINSKYKMKERKESVLNNEDNESSGDDFGPSSGPGGGMDFGGMGGGETNNDLPGAQAQSTGTGGAQAQSSNAQTPETGGAQATDTGGGAQPPQF